MSDLVFFSIWKAGDNEWPVSLPQRFILHYIENRGIVNCAMAKLLPDKKNIGRMLDSLSSDEQKEFLHELLNLNIGMFSGNAVAYQEELRRVILAWEYTVAVKTNPDFLATMENSIEEALNCPPEECVDWRTLLEG